MGTVRVSSSGNAATYNSYEPFPNSYEPFPETEGSDLYAFYVSIHTGAGWSTQNFIPKTLPGAPGDVTGITKDLSQVLVESRNEPPLVPEPEATQGREGIYLRDTINGIYKLLVQLPAEEKPALELIGTTPVIELVGDAGNDSRIFLETNYKLVPEAVFGVENLYEWYEGKLSLVDKEAKAPFTGGAMLGAAEVNYYDGERHEERKRYYTEGAVSESGEYIYFTDLATHKVYIHEPRATPAITVAISKGAALWANVIGDGSNALYIEEGNLYRFNAVDSSTQPLTEGDAAVIGVLGTGDDGAYVYFVAEGALARGASQGGINLYEWHEGTISFIARLQSPEGSPTGGDLYDWTPRVLGESGSLEGPAVRGGRSSRVSRDGQILMFSSTGSLTGYDNVGHDEIYVYSAITGRITCVSCNPRGVPATSNVYLYQPSAESLNLTPVSPEVLPRNLSDGGSRVFFETAEPLLPQASNGQLNVYEWEAEGTGSCANSQGSCLYLLSSGQSDQPSYFAGASASGNDVFVFTRQSLVGQDTDQLVDVYDVRVDGGLAAQNLSAQLGPCLGEACRPVRTFVPSFGVPISQVFSSPFDHTTSVASVAVTKPKPSSIRARKRSKATSVCRKKQLLQQRRACGGHAKIKIKQSTRKHTLDT